MSTSNYNNPDLGSEGAARTLEHPLTPSVKNPGGFMLNSQEGG